MKKGFFCILIAAMAMSGCGSMLPSSKLTYKSPWDSFEEAKSAFDKITPYETNTKEMQALGFDPFTTPNIRILTYVDIMNRFMPNPSVKKEELQKAYSSV